jgi:hypothetical protein
MRLPTLRTALRTRLKVERLRVEVRLRCFLGTAAATMGGESVGGVLSGAVEIDVGGGAIELEPPRPKNFFTRFDRPRAKLRIVFLTFIRRFFILFIYAKNSRLGLYRMRTFDSLLPPPFSPLSQVLHPLFRENETPL